MSTIKEKIGILHEDAKQLWDQHKQEIVFVLIVFLVSSLSFGLGYLMAQQNNPAPIIIEKHTTK